MSELSEGIEALDNRGGSTNTVQIESLVQETVRDLEQSDQMSASLNAAFERILTLPGDAGEVSVSFTEMSGRAAGPVGDAKDNILSDVARPGVETVQDTATDRMEQLTENVKSLYVDMTNWQVAWSIAQRTQQDTNHLLRGS